MARRCKSPVPSAYGARSRRQQRDAFIRLRWAILRKTPIFGGLFTSILVLEDTNEPGYDRQSFEFLFLGLDGRTIWNADIITPCVDFYEKLDDLAWERAVRLLTEEEREEEFQLILEPISAGREQLYRHVHREKRRYARFGGLTFNEYERQLKKQIVAEEPPAVRESFEIDRTCRYGIGVRLIVDADKIDRSVINEAIERFRAQNESSWAAPENVPRQRLPFDTGHW